MCVAFLSLSSPDSGQTFFNLPSSLPTGASYFSEGRQLEITTGRRRLQASTGRKGWYSKKSLRLTKLPWTPNKFYQFLFYLSWYCEAESTQCRPCGRWSSLTPHQRWSFQMTTCKISFTSFHLPSYIFIFFMSGLSSTVILVSRVSCLLIQPTSHWRFVMWCWKSK